MEIVAVDPDEDGYMTAAIDELAPATEYSFQAFAVTASGTTRSDVKSFITDELAPTVEADEIAQEDIYPDCVTLTGKIEIGTEEILTCGFLYGTDSEQENNSDVAEAQMDAEGNISATVTGLTPDETYYFWAFAKTASGTVYSSVESFDTPELIETQVTTDSQAEDITMTSATISGEIVLGNQIVSEYGFKYAVDEVWESAASIIVEADMDGKISCTLEGLKPGTEYNFRAYAVVSGETVYGTAYSFITEEIVTINAIIVADQSTTADLSAAITEGAQVSDCGFLYGESSDLDSASEAAGTTQTDGGFKCTLEILTISETYYVWAYVTVDGERYYTQTYSFVAGNSDTSIIRGIVSDQDAAEEIARFDLSGRRLAKPQKGINIVLYSDGTAKKIVVKE